MSTKPYFSVIIPTYNRLSLCKSTLDSVLSQTYEDYEILVIDDGSTDGTKEYFSSINHPRLTYIFQENSGVSTARNLGVSLSSGEYICYLDSDDVWFENKLAEMYSVIRDYPDIDVIFHDFHKHDIKRTKPYEISNSDIFHGIYDILHHFEKSKVWFGQPKEAFELVMRGYPFYPSVITIKREVHNQYLWDPGVLKSEDFNLIVKLSLKYKFGYLDRSLTVVKVHENNKSADMLTKDTVIINTMRVIRDLYCTDNNRRIATEAIARKKYYSGLGHIKQGNYMPGFFWFIQALFSPLFYRARLSKLNRPGFSGDPVV